MLKKPQRKCKYQENYEYFRFNQMQYETKVCSKKTKKKIKTLKKVMNSAKY